MTCSLAYPQVHTQLHPSTGDSPITTGPILPTCSALLASTAGSTIQLPDPQLHVCLLAVPSHILSASAQQRLDFTPGVINHSCKPRTRPGMEKALTEDHEMDVDYLDGPAISTKRSILSTVTEGTLRYTKGA